MRSMTQLQLQLISQDPGQDPPQVGVQKPVKILLIVGGLPPAEQVNLQPPGQPLVQRQPPGQQMVILQPPGQPRVQLPPAQQQQLVQLFGQAKLPGQPKVMLIPPGQLQVIL